MAARGVARNRNDQDNSFDFVVMVTVICFLDDVGKAFKEAWRILVHTLLQLKGR
jgi:ubiquinone/menaquinone biosynthesis C-methylase UbiE